MSDWKSRRIKNMEMVLRDFCRKEKGNKNTLGLLLFGSLAIKKTFPDSDIDVLVIAKSDRPRTRIMFEGEIIDKITRMVATLEDYVSKGFSLDWLTEGKILYDPHGEITRLRTQAERFEWSKAQILSNKKNAKKHLAMAERLLEHDLRSCLFLLHKASEECLRIQAKRNGVKTNVDIGDFFRIVRTKDKLFYEFFRDIQGLTHLSRRELEVYLHKLEYKKWDRLNWNVSQILKEAHNKKLSTEEVKTQLLPLWRKVPTSSLHSAGDCLRNGDLECALLYLRETSLWYARVKRRNYETLLTRLNQSEPEYFHLFLEINGLTQVTEINLQEYISFMNELLK